MADQLPNDLITQQFAAASGSHELLSAPSIPEIPNPIVAHDPEGQAHIVASDQGARQHAKRHAVLYGNALRQHMPQLGEDEINRREGLMEGHAFEAARDWQLQQLAQQKVGRGGIGTAEYWGQRLPFARKGIAALGKEDTEAAQRHFAAGDADALHYHTMAENLAEKATEDQKGVWGHIRDATTGLIPVGVEWASMSGGAGLAKGAVGGIARALGEGKLASIASFGAQQAAAGALRTAAQPSADPKEMLGDFLSNTLFEASGIFNVKAAATWKGTAGNALKKWGTAMATMEASEDARKLAAGAQEGGPVWQYVTAKTEEERAIALKKLAGMAGATAILEGGLHAAHMVGGKVDQKKLAESISEELVKNGVAHEQLNASPEVPIVPQPEPAQATPTAPARNGQVTTPPGSPALPGEAQEAQAAQGEGAQPQIQGAETAQPGVQAEPANGAALAPDRGPLPAETRPAAPSAGEPAAPAAPQPAAGEPGVLSRPVDEAAHAQYRKALSQEGHAPVGTIAGLLEGNKTPAAKELIAKAGDTPVFISSGMPADVPARFIHDAKTGQGFIQLNRDRPLTAKELAWALGHEGAHAARGKAGRPLGDKLEGYESSPQEMSANRLAEAISGRKAGEKAGEPGVLSKWSDERVRELGKSLGPTKSKSREGIIAELQKKGVDLAMIEQSSPTGETPPKPKNGMRPKASTKLTPEEDAAVKTELDAIERKPTNGLRPEHRDIANQIRAEKENTAKQEAKLEAASKQLMEFQQSPEFQKMTEQEQKRAFDAKQKELGLGPYFNPATTAQKGPTLARIRGMQYEANRRVKAERGLVGGGSGEGEDDLTRPVRTAALANEKVDEAREKMGLPPRMKEAAQSDPAVWDRAMKMLEADPAASRKLVDELTAKPRPATPEENMLLLHRMVEADNDHNAAMLDYIEAMRRDAAAKGSVQPHEFDALEAKEKSLLQEKNRVYDVADTSGTQAGRAFRLRRLLMAEDYAFEGLLRRAQVAKGEPLTFEEKAEYQRLAGLVKELQGKLDEALASKEPVKPGEFRGQKEMAAQAAIKQGLDQSIREYKYKQSPVDQKAVNIVVDAFRMLKLTSPKSIFKIGASSITGLVKGPLAEAAGSGLRQLPFIKKVMAAAPSEGAGFSPTIEFQAKKAAFTDGFQDSLDKIKTGDSELDILAKNLKVRPAEEEYGSKQGGAVRTTLDMPGRIHGALKAPLMREAYARSMLQRQAFNKRNGVEQTAYQDVQDAKGALQDGYRAIFQENNAAAKLWNRLLTGSTALLKESGVSAGVAALPEAAGRIAVPFPKTPTNIVKQALTEYLGGLPIGLTRIAISEATGKLTPKQADSISRQLKNGTVGGALAALGFYLGPQVVGSLYQRGQKREEDTDVPEWSMHHSLTQAVQMGATMKKNLESAPKTGPHKGEHPGALEAGLSTMMDEVRQQPHVRAAGDLYSLTSPQERGYTIGSFVKGSTVPAGVDWLARTLDRRGGKEVKRSPKSVLEHVESGVPGLRQKVPEKNGMRR